MELTLIIEYMFEIENKVYVGAPVVLRRLRRWLILRDPEVRYIVEVGVDEIPEVRDPVPQAEVFLGKVSEHIESTSRFLDTEEAVAFFILNTESRVRYSTRLYGLKGQTILLLTASPEPLKGPWLLVVEGEEGWLGKLLVYNNMITGAQVMTKLGEYYGKAALDFIENARGEVRVDAVRLKRRAFEWDPSRFSVFVRGIDRQHQYLVAVLNMAYLGLVGGQGRRALEEVVDRMVEYTKFHFRSEEVLFDRFHYPEDRAERHRREHRQFTLKALEFREKFMQGEAELTLDVLRYLAQWLQGHIGGSDRAFGVWLKEVAQAPITE